MMIKSRAGFRLAVVVLAAALVATACGDDDDATTTTTIPTIRRPMVVAFGEAPDTVDPHLPGSPAALAITNAVYEPPVVALTFEVGGVRFSDEDSTILGAGALNGSLEPTESGGWIWTFNLRRDAEFENGGPVTASDYEYAISRALEAPGSIAEPFFASIGLSSADQVTVVDDFTLTLETPVTNPLMEEFLTFPMFAAVDRELVEANATAGDPWGFAFLGERSAGAGAYYIAQFSPDTEVVLEPNPNYWDAENVANSGVVIRTIADPEERVRLLRSGELDLAAGIPGRLLPELADDPSIKLIDLPTTGVAYLAINLDLVPNVEVRRAIIAAVPYQELIDQVMFGYAAPAGGIVTSTMETHDPAVGAGYATDLDAARAHLEGSGESDVSLALGVRESRLQDQEAAVLIQENLLEVGIEVEVQVLPDAEWVTRASAGELPLLIHDWFSWGEDPFYQMQTLTGCGSFANYSGFCDETYDQLLEIGIVLGLDMVTSLGEGDDAEDVDRDDLSSRAQQILFDAAAIAPLWSPRLVFVTGGCVTGLELGYSRVPSFKHFTELEDCATG